MLLLLPLLPFFSSYTCCFYSILEFLYVPLDSLGGDVFNIFFNWSSSSSFVLATWDSLFHFIQSLFKAFSMNLINFLIFSHEVLFHFDFLKLFYPFMNPISVSWVGLIIHSAVCVFTVSVQQLFLTSLRFLTMHVTATLKLLFLYAI